MRIMMTGSRYSKIGALIGLVALILSACGDPTATSTPKTAAFPTPGKPVKLPNTTIPSVADHTATLVNHLDSTTIISFSVSISLPTTGDLQKLVDSQDDPKSGKFGQVISPDQFNKTYAPTDQQVQQVEAGLLAMGFETSYLSDNRQQAILSGSVDNIEKTFQVKMNEYKETRSEGGQDVEVQFYANDSDLSVPENAVQYITSIQLNDYPLSRSLAIPLQTTNSPNAAFQGYTPEQLRSAYDVTPLIDQGFDGSGQTIALVEFDTYKPSDIAQYAKQFNLPTPQIENVIVDHFNRRPGAGAGEVTLDIEVLMAIAPKAKILVYEAPNSGQAWLDIFNKIVTDNRAQVVSISWGMCEQMTTTNMEKAFNNIVLQGKSQGITFYAASGDSGAYDCGRRSPTTLAVDSPASNPYVVGVGGTTLQNNGTSGNESVWGDTQRKIGGGGGLSNVWQLPKFQTGPGVDSVNNTKGTRLVPDVSADADPRTGYAIYCTANFKGCGTRGWTVIGGTSAAAPLWAACGALFNQVLASKFGNKYRFTGNPVIYALANGQLNTSKPAFNDITSGNNLYYKAGQGYDVASGWGSPDAANIASDLVEDLQAGS